MLTSEQNGGYLRAGADWRRLRSVTQTHGRCADRRLGARDVRAKAGSWRRPDYPLYVSVLCVWLRAGPPFFAGAVVAQHAGVDREAGWRRL